MHRSLFYEIIWRRSRERKGIVRMKTMVSISLLAVALFTATEVSAISRHNIGSMSCAAVQGILEREGAAILRYPSTRVQGMTLYDRYVADGRYCSSDEYGKRATVPVGDTANCPVLRCEKRSYDDCRPFTPGCF